VSTQIALGSQQLQCCRSDLLQVTAKLPMKHRVIVRIHAALENLCIDGSVKEPCRYPQRVYTITASPGLTDFAAF
jgi:hypothetical protein